MKRVVEDNTSLSELIYQSYANLAMAHAAVVNGQEKYNRLSYMIRSRLLKSLGSGEMNIRTFFDDEKIKLETGSICGHF